MCWLVLVQGNPLLAPKSAQIKRKWNDDVVFKNQVSSEDPNVMPSWVLGRGRAL